MHTVIDARLSLTDPHAVARHLLSTFEVQSLAVILNDIIHAHPGILEAQTKFLDDKRAADHGESSFRAQLLDAVRAHNISQVRQILQRLHADCLDMQSALRYKETIGNTLLHLCVKSRSSSQCDMSHVLQLLVDWKCPVDVIDNRGETPLLSLVRAASLYCISSAQADVVEAVNVLLSARADVNAVDSQGMTSLMEAAWSIDLCRVLLSARADTGLRSNTNLSALDFADDNAVSSLLVDTASEPSMRAATHVQVENAAAAAPKPRAPRWMSAAQERHRGNAEETAERASAADVADDVFAGDAASGDLPNMEAPRNDPCWTCTNCEEVNRARRLQCNNCGWEAPAASSPHGVPSLPAVSAGQQKSASSGSRKQAAFFGIADLKYDTRRKAGDRLHVLELGDGKKSRFSGHGEPILKAFQETYYVANASKLHVSALVENKRTTHEVFVECGLERLRPLQVCYPRVYRPDLASEIASRLQCTGVDGQRVPVVLKLLNRCRGAGVVLANAGQELDDMLQRLLCPPEYSHLGNASVEKALASDANSIHEQCLHWWSNECPVFVAERCSPSHALMREGRSYDATMRVGFVLLRGPNCKEKLDVTFLGGYWKLPPETKDCIDLRKRLLSEAKSGTAPVSEDDLSAVYDSLRDALPLVFDSARVDVPAIMDRYALEPLLFAFTVARQVSEQAARSPKATSEITESLFKQVEDALGPSNGVDELDLPTRAATSHMLRQRGALLARRGNWELAEDYFRRSLEQHRWNASSQYLLGVCFLRKHQYSSAHEAFARSIQIDADFKASYVNLGMTAISQSEWDSAIAVSEVGLKRFPQAFQCNYNLALALTRQLVAKLKAHLTGPTSTLEAAAEHAIDELRKARDQKEVAKSEWSHKEDKLLLELEQVVASFEIGTPCWSIWGPLDKATAGLRGWTFLNFHL